MAIEWAVKKCEFYLTGIPHFTIITDHKPLLGVFEKNLTEITNNRLQKYREFLNSFNFTLEWQPGKVHLLADCLSRSPVEAMEQDWTEDNEVVCRRIMEDPSFDMILDNADEEYSQIIKHIKEDPKGSPKNHPILRAYQQVWDKLSLIEEGGEILVVLDGDRAVVPKDARKEILKLLHLPHTGMAKTYATIGLI